MRASVEIAMRNSNLKDLQSSFVIGDQALVQSSSRFQNMASSSPSAKDRQDINRKIKAGKAMREKAAKSEHAWYRTFPTFAASQVSSTAVALYGFAQKRWRESKTTPKTFEELLVVEESVSKTKGKKAAKRTVKKNNEVVESSFSLVASSAAALSGAKMSLKTNETVRHTIVALLAALVTLLLLYTGKMFLQ